MNTLHLEALTDAGKALFSKLGVFNDGFYLAGGTALALQLGHRVSVDYDFFSPEPIKRTLLARVENDFAGAALAPMVATSRELTVMVSGVKCTFLHYPFPVVLPFTTGAPIPLLSIQELLATKAYTIGRRGVFKDYIDLWAGITEGAATLPETVALADQKYGDAFNDRLFLEQLLYLDDVADENLIMLGRAQPSKQALRDFFFESIQKVSLAG